MIVTEIVTDVPVDIVCLASYTADAGWDFPLRYLEDMLESPAYCGSPEQQGNNRARRA